MNKSHVDVPYVRVTILSEHRNADLALPRAVPLGLTLPSVLELLDASTSARRKELVTETGQVLNPDIPLDRQGVQDGALLSLVEAAEAPPEPIVYDMVDVAEDARPRGVWGVISRQWVIAFLSVGCLAASVLLWLSGHDSSPRLVWAVAGIAALGASAVARALGGVPAAWTFALGGAAAGAFALWSEHGQVTYWHVAVYGMLLLAAIGWCALQPVMSGLAVATVGLSAGLIALTRILIDGRTLQAGVVCVVLVLLSGLLPRAALAASGTFNADTKVAAGGELRRADAVARVAHAHWALAGAVVSLGVVLAWSLFVLAQASSLAPWPAALCVTLIVALGLRARHFPLAIERGALWGSALVGACGVAGAAQTRFSNWPHWLVPLVVVALAAAVLLTTIVRPSPLHVARGRRIAVRVESLAVAATLPLLIGAFGVYSQLLHSFS